MIFLTKKCRERIPGLQSNPLCLTIFQIVHTFPNRIKSGSVLVGVASIWTSGGFKIRGTRVLCRGSPRYRWIGKKLPTISGSSTTDSMICLIRFFL
uniref:Uncharacterized protein n=1 Tax=Utricularia reniformis TaxID=192314 RepID=A0A1Y0B2W5_9LAMI|nr:hypothetical protein AEK19_MT1523 [Utricularia reniformis]ART31713.1 hypothetical protein AEK19_MT1523 [Utricularia reniformis]